MPVTFLHCSFAYLVNKWKRHFSLPALLVGSMVPDLEVPIIYFLNSRTIDRLVLHSVLGAATIGTAISVFLVLFIYSPVVSFIFRLDQKEVKAKCRFSGTLVIASFIGVLSHVLIDATHHPYNPLLYPFVGESFDLFVITGSVPVDFTITTLVVSAILLVFIIDFAKKGIKDFWKRMLVG